MSALILEVLDDVPWKRFRVTSTQWLIAFVEIYDDVSNRASAYIYARY